MISKFIFELERAGRQRWEVPRISEGADVALLASYPKSGNTWLRFIASNIVASKLNRDDVDFESISNYAPEVRYNRKLDGMISAAGIPNLLKTHFPFVKGYSDIKSVVLFRDPKRSIVSYYHYMKHEHLKDYGALAKFVNSPRKGIDYWNFYHKSWMSSSAFFVSYDDLLRNPIDGLGLIYKELGVELDSEFLRVAVSRATKEKMANLELTKGDPFKKNINYSFVNKSASRDVREAGMSEVTARIDEECSQVYNALLEKRIRF
jgi:hypothetical protein